MPPVPGPAEQPVSVLGAPDVTEGEWDALAERAGNVFATRQWLETWERHEPARHGLLTLASRHPDGRLAGLLPLQVHRRFPRILRPMGPWPPPTGPLICAEEDTELVLRDITGQLAARGGWDVLELDAVPCDEPWTDVLTGVTFATSPSRVIELAGKTWDDLLGAMSRNLRADIRRRERRLRERYSVRFRLATASSLDADIDMFMKLHLGRWGGEVNVFHAQRAAVLRDFAEQALDRGWLALWMLELDGTAVATELNFRFAGREVNMFTGWDVAYRSDSVSLALLFHTIKTAAADGMREFDVLRGDQGYKARLPHRNRPVAHIGLSARLPGRTAIRARATARDLVQNLRDSRLNEHRRRLAHGRHRNDGLHR